ncbi:MAG: hypothetical protein UE630_02725 [Oscillospiraceae bacterium]|nr:hypothetical protein [Oscillospiraceae bacterium]
METTTNYKLPQWVKADQIKMDDFNGAFANIDAALKANADAAASKASSAELDAVQQEVAAAREANCLVKLAGPIVTTTENAAMEFDLSQVDMTKIAALFFTFCAGSSSGNMEISVNGTSLGTACSNSWSTTAGILWLVPMSGDVSFVSTLVLNNSNGTAGYGGCGAVKWDAVNKVTLAGTSSAGATATLFAVKK